MQAVKVAGLVEGFERAIPQSSRTWVLISSYISQNTLLWRIMYLNLRLFASELAEPMVQFVVLGHHGT
jgi:hypothetical protein